MAKDQELDWSTTADNNLDVGGADISEGCAPGGINDAIRKVMAQRAASITRHVAKAAGTHTAQKSDHNQFWRCTGAVTINFTAAATLSAGWSLWVRANGGAVTVDANLAELIDGAGVLVIPDGQQALIVCDGVGFHTEFMTGQIAGRQTIASAATTDLATLRASYVQVTGTTTITALGSMPAGRVIVLEFAAALTLTHNATSLILTGACDYTTVPGDVVMMVSEGSGNWRMAASSRPGVPRVVVEDQKAATTASGTFTSGTRQTRTLNTVVLNTITGASLVTNQVVLPPGTYEIEWSAPAYRVDAHKTYLRNVTDSVDVAVGSTEYANNVNGLVQNRSLGRTTVAITANKAFTIQHRCDTTQPANGFGQAPVFSDGVEVFAQLKATKIA